MLSRKYILPSFPLPHISLGKAANQLIATGVNVKILFDVVIYSYRIQFNPATNDVTILEDGLYSIMLSNQWQNNAVGTRGRGLFINGVIAYTNLYSAPLGGTTVNMVNNLTTFLNAGETIDFRVSQNSGGNLNLIGAVRGSPELTIVKLTQPVQ